jgi:antitoxin ParD1/3/4
MAAAEKLSVTLTAEMVRDLEASVAAGEFASTSEALRDAVRLWRNAREERAERLAAIRARLKASAEDTRPRLTADEVFGRLQRTREARLRHLIADEAA